MIFRFCALAPGPLILVLLMLACSGSSTPLPTNVEPTAAPIAATSVEASDLPSTPALNPRAPGTVPASPTPIMDVATLEPTPTVPLARPPAPDFIPDAPERDLYQLTEELVPGVSGPIDRVVNREPVSYSQGRRDTFWLVDLPALGRYSSEFELRLVTPHAYWYVEDGLSVAQKDLERSAFRYEEEVYPRVTATFGMEWTPGVDNDPHLNILNANLRGVGGYYSASDEYPIVVDQYSNQREIIYINTGAGAFPVGTTGYLETLAHELQHAIHWNHDRSEDTWVNEGLSELAATVAGFDQFSIFRFLTSRPTSLVHWPLTAVGAGANYGAASLFMHYLVEHYGDWNDLTGLIKEPLDGIAGIDSYLAASAYSSRFRDVFRDWLVANLLDEDQGRYSYGELSVQQRVTQSIRDFGSIESQVPQYASEYVEIEKDLLVGPIQVSFQGATETALLPVEVPAPGCWWGNSGDSIDASLTRTLDLSSLEQASLAYRIWFDLEEDWDYAYLEVSLDEGETWAVLGTPNTTSENPIGNSYGEGYTGKSDGWLTESVDLTPYAGGQIQVRFQHITDDAINGDGVCVAGISVPHVGLMDLVDGWESNGFVFTGNRVKQGYIVQVIVMGDKNRVTQMSLDDANAGELTVEAPAEFDQVVVAVAALAPKTRQSARYTLRVQRPG